MKKIEIILLFLILAGALSARLYKFGGPVADWHSWRQADTSAVSRNFAEHGFDILHPRFDDLSKGVSLIDNPQGYRYVEFPIYNIAQAALYKSLGQFSIEEWGRLVTIFSSLGATVFIYLIVRKYSNLRTALFASFFFAFIPYSIYYGRTILPDMSMVAAILGGIYFFGKWIGEKSQIFFAAALIFTAVAILLKPFALFFMLPMLVIAFQQFGFGFIKKPSLWVFFALSVSPLVFWRAWMEQYPQGIPRNDWLFNGSKIRFKGAFFHWIFGQRIAELILGYFGLPFVLLGIIKKSSKKEGLFFLSFLVSSLIYITVLATGNVQHDYYQVLILPTIAIFFGKGVDFILDGTSTIFNKPVSFLVIISGILLMLSFGWFLVRDYYNIHPEVVLAGEAVDKLTPKDSKIIAPYGGDTTLLYNAKRRGWPVFDRPLPDFIKQGADYMVFVNPQDAELNFKNYFAVAEEGDKYIIYDLKKPLKPLE